MRPMLLLIVLSIPALSQTPDPTPVDARISGSVVNEVGKPVAGAIVCAREDASSFVDAGCTTTRTDVAGRFDFGAKLKHGLYEVYARKEKDGYPDPTSTFYQPLNFKLQNVQLFGDHPAENIKLELKDKGAILSGRVYDADTGRPLKAGIGFSNLQTSGGRGVVASEGKFSELIPSNTDVVVEVQEVDQDHADWSLYTAHVNLHPGQVMHINVPLYKTSTGATSQ